MCRKTEYKYENSFFFYINTQPVHNVVSYLSVCIFFFFYVNYFLLLVKIRNVQATSNLINYLQVVYQLIYRNSIL